MAVIKTFLGRSLERESDSDEVLNGNEEYLCGAGGKARLNVIWPSTWLTVHVFQGLGGALKNDGLGILLEKTYDRF